MPLPAGSRLGSYEIVRLLGQGGMGEVYLAHDARLGREIALKLLPADTAADSDRRARFEREARMAAALKHPHICTIHEVGQADGQPFIAMEYVEGTTLRDRVRVDLFSLKETLDIAIQIADALDEARQKKVVHRDLKSANILLTPRGDVKILDFGLAKRVDEVRAHDATTEGGVTDAGMVIGTAAYMSPEQALGQPVDHRSDLFSFGVVLYELLTGRLPFTGKTSMELFSAILHGAPQPIPRFNETVPDALVRVVGKLLEKDREQRYQSAREVVTDLKRIRDEGASSVTSPAPVRVRSKPWWWLAAAGIVVIVAAAALWISHGRQAVTVPVTLVIMPAQVHGAPLSPYLTDAFAQTTSTDLAQVDGLDVKPPPTSLELERFQGDVKRAVSAYDVQYYIQPIVYVDGTLLKVTVQIIDRGADRLMPGSLEYEGTLATFLPLIHRASDGVRAALRPSAVSVTKGPAGQSTSSEAELAYQQGVYLSDRYNNNHEGDDFTRAKASLLKALQIDPSFAAAAAEIAILYAYQSEAPGAPADTMAQVEKWVVTAFEKNPRISRGWTARGFRELGRAPRNDAAWLEAALRAVALGPDDNLALAVLANGAQPIEIQLELARRIRALRPVYEQAHVNYASGLLASGQAAEAVTILDEVLATDPNMGWGLLLKGVALADLGRTDEADGVGRRLRPMVQAQTVLPTDLQTLEYAIAVTKRNRADAQKAIVPLVQALTAPGIGNSILVSTTSLVLPFMARAGDLEPAFRLIDLCLDRHLTVDLSSDPRMSTLLQQPRAQRAVASVRASLQALLPVIQAARGRGEFPAYLEAPLGAAVKRLGVSEPR